MTRISLVTLENVSGRLSRLSDWLMSQRDWGRAGMEEEGGGVGVVGWWHRMDVHYTKLQAFICHRGIQGTTKTQRRGMVAVFRATQSLMKDIIDIFLNYFKKVLKELSSNAGHTKGRTTKRTKATILIFWSRYCGFCESEHIQIPPSLA